MKQVIFGAMLSLAMMCSAQLRNDDVYKLTHINKNNVRTEYAIPGFDGYVTLKCDFHTHTVFSDGLVWPTIRVTEAWLGGLDAIAITDHIEYRPHKDVLKGDLNESYKLAKKKADDIGFIVIQGTEITRSKPLGHLNALFIKDANVMDVEDPLVALDRALEQGGVILWNHPGWPDNKSTLYPVHEELLKAGKIHAVEVLNHKEYYPVVFDWFGKYDIAPMSNTDIHDLISSDYGWNDSKMRPVTLVFATEKSENAIKEALLARRTVAMFDGMLVGKAEYLTKLLGASLAVNKINEKFMEVTNVSDIAFEITGNGNLYIFPPRKTVRINIPKSGDYVVENCYVAKDKKLQVTWNK